MVITIALYFSSISLAPSAMQFIYDNYHVNWMDDNNLDIIRLGKMMYNLLLTSSYSTRIFCRGVSGFATDCPCDVWCRGLTICLLHVGPPFGNRFLNTSWAVGLTYWMVYLHFLYFDICKYICLDTSYHFLALFLLLKYSLFFFKYSCTNIFHRRSLCTFYWHLATTK